MIKLYTTEELAAMLNVSPRTVRRERAAGRLPYVRIRKQVRYRECDVQQYLGNCVLEQEKAAEKEEKQSWSNAAPLRPAAAQAGFTLMETIIVVTVMAMLSAVMVPVVSDFINKARTVRAQHDIRVLTDALTRYAADSSSAIRPNMDATLGEVDLLVSQGKMPAEDVSANDSPAILASASLRAMPQVRTWSYAKAAPIEEVFARRPEDNKSENKLGRSMRTSVASEQAFGFRGERGPYLAKALKDDPWGNRYMINIGDAPNLIGHGFRGSEASARESAVFVISAGSDRKIQTPRGQSVEFADVKGDDIAIRIN